MRKTIAVPILVMKKIKILVLSLNLLLITQLAFAPATTGWMPSYTTQLGVKLEYEPAVDEY